MVNFVLDINVSFEVIVVSKGCSTMIALKSCVTLAHTQKNTHSPKTNTPETHKTHTHTHTQADISTKTYTKYIAKKKALSQAPRCMAAYFGMLDEGDGKGGKG